MEREQFNLPILILFDAFTRDSKKGDFFFKALIKYAKYNKTMTPEEFGEYEMMMREIWK